MRYLRYNLNEEFGSFLLSVMMPFYLQEGSTSLELDGNLYVGGLGPPFSDVPIPPALWTAVLGQGFVGCLADLKINNAHIDVAKYAREQDSGKRLTFPRFKLPQLKLLLQVPLEPYVICNKNNALPSPVSTTGPVSKAGIASCAIVRTLHSLDQPVEKTPPRWRSMEASVRNLQWTVRWRLKRRMSCYGFVQEGPRVC